MRAAEQINRCLDVAVVVRLQRDLGVDLDTNDAGASRVLQDVHFHGALIGVRLGGV